MSIKIKSHQMPGDIGKTYFQKLIEGKGSHSENKRGRTLLKLLKMRERAVLKERARKEISQ